MSSTKYKHADQVWHRVVQIIQEAMLMGVDCVDLLRQIEVCPDEANVGQLVLSPEYAAQVEKMHASWLAKAQAMQEEMGEDPDFANEPTDPAVKNVVN